jgi:hypothetical protein
MVTVIEVAPVTIAAIWYSTTTIVLIFNPTDLVGATIWDGRRKRQ